MPKNKKQNSDSDSDSGPDDRNPPAKKSKSAKTSSARTDDEEPCWQITNNRMIKLREFKGKYYVDIREYYNADGEMKPGKKGISLTLEQWHKFKDLISEVDEAIKKNV